MSPTLQLCSSLSPRPRPSALPRVPATRHSLQYIRSSQCPLIPSTLPAPFNTPYTARVSISSQPFFAPPRPGVSEVNAPIVAGKYTRVHAVSPACPTRILHLLAQNPDVQEKLRAELTEARGGPGNMGDIDYDNLVKLPYLDAVCRETLRVFPPLSMVVRT